MIRKAFDGATLFLPHRLPQPVSYLYINCYYIEKCCPCMNIYQT